MTGYELNQRPKTIKKGDGNGVNGIAVEGGDLESIPSDGDA